MKGAAGRATPVLLLGACEQRRAPESLARSGARRARRQIHTAARLSVAGNDNSSRASPVHHECSIPRLPGHHRRGGPTWLSKMGQRPRRIRRTGPLKRTLHLQGFSFVQPASRLSRPAAPAGRYASGSYSRWPTTVRTTGARGLEERRAEEGDAAADRGGAGCAVAKDE